MFLLCRDSMAKSLLKHTDFSCTSLEVEEGEVAPLGCEMIPLLMDIINTQNLVRL